MDKDYKSLDDLVYDLQERAKELNCLYRIEELLSNHELSMEEVLQQIVEALPPGWQYPHTCVAKIIFDNKVYVSPEFQETTYSLL
jgi:hypothetical protein